MTFTISTDRADVDLDVVAEFLGAQAYWALGRPRDVIERSIAGSAVVVSAHDDAGMVGFGRVVSDEATFAWLADVFVLPRGRGRGIGRALVETAVGAPQVAGVKRVLLATADAHDLYRRVGFEPLSEPDRWMAITRDRA